MRNIKIRTALSILFAALAGNAVADKPSWAGGGKQERRAEEGRGTQRQFADTQVRVVRDWYGEEMRRGHCPPGLAKKNNGCQPPGQAKKWARGRPLPPGLVYHDLPPQLVVQLGRPPAGHKYVRIAADILLIAVGSSLVIDAIEDLGRM